MTTKQTFHQTFQFRAYTSRAGYAQLDQVLAQQCVLYNAALEHRRTAWKMAGVRISNQAQRRELTELRRDDPHMAALSRRVQCGTLARLDRAFEAYFRRVAAGEKPGHPRFKSLRRWNTLEVDSPKHERAWLKFLPESGRAYLTLKGLPKLEMKLPEAKARYLQELNLQKKWNGLAITRRGRRVTVTMTFEVTREPRPGTGAIVGLNRGVASTLATSDGLHYQGSVPDAGRRRRLQRQLSRAVIGSRKRRKKLAVYSNFLSREALAKRNEIHRITSKLVSENDFIAIEDYDIRAMTRSGRGTVESPGTNVRLTAQLNRSIREQNWGLIEAQLAYKAAWAGKQFVKVEPQFISQDCSTCGHRRVGPFPNRIFRCRNCGLRINQDTNAAINVLRLGRAQAGAETPGPDAPQGVC
ncbi:MAG: transposase [Chloroflexota bacterium]|nr:transposase [Chloroflexota bacterium]